VQDASISSLGYSSSGNPVGTLYKTNDALYTYTLDYTTKGLIRFDVSALPVGATVTAATLDVTFESWVGPQTLNGNFLKTPWSYTSTALGWANGGAGSAWATPGIGVADTLGPTFQFLAVGGTGYQRKSVPLDIASVQAWVGNSAANQGLVLANADVNKVLRICSSEAANIAQRPTLAVTFQ